MVDVFIYFFKWRLNKANDGANISAGIANRSYRHRLGRLPAIRERWKGALGIPPVPHPSRFSWLLSTCKDLWCTDVIKNYN